MAYQYNLDSTRCKGCGLCVSICPKHVLEISDEVSAQGYFPAYQARPDDCIVCSLCCVMCPDVAITITELAEDEVKIVVVLKEEITPEELLDFCQERMPYFAIPRYVEFVKSLPRTPTDKVQKNLLREAGVTGTTWDREKAGYSVKR